MKGDLGSLAYDPARDTLFLATPTTLYASTAGGEFVARATDLDWSIVLTYAHPAAVLDNGLNTYIVQP